MKKREILALTVVILFSILACASAWASEDSVPNDILKKNPAKNKLADKLFLLGKTSPTEIYDRTREVLTFFRVPEEASNDDLINLYSGVQPAPEVKRIISLMDFTNQFVRFTKNNSVTLTFFNDRDGFERADVALDYSANAQPGFTSGAMARLAQAKNNPAEFPLQGLRIALDPGHMSTKEWEKRTGKFVRDRRGVTISEGLINLQTALLLKTEFEKLGAQVKLTREHHNPVAETAYETLDIDTYAKKALRAETLDDWFLTLVANYSSNDVLFKKFKEDQNFKNLFLEKARSHYFILGADLDARVESIEEFNPDITLVIHYDSQDPANNPNGVNSKRYSRVKTYIHGSIDPVEWARKEDRRFIIHKLFDSKSTNASLNLASSVVQGLKKELKLNFDQGGGGSSKMVAPGVFARNLFITRKLHGHAHTYVECLHYNDPGEFKAMLSRDFKLVIQGETTYYSKRLKQVVDGIKNGVVSFVSSN